MFMFCSQTPHLCHQVKQLHKALQPEYATFSVLPQICYRFAGSNPGSLRELASIITYVSALERSAGDIHMDGHIERSIISTIVFTKFQASWLWAFGRHHVILLPQGDFSRTTHRPMTRSCNDERSASSQRGDNNAWLVMLRYDE